MRLFIYKKKAVLENASSFRTVSVIIGILISQCQYGVVIAKSFGEEVVKKWNKIGKRYKRHLNFNEDYSVKIFWQQALKEMFRSAIAEETVGWRFWFYHLQLSERRRSTQCQNLCVSSMIYIIILKVIFICVKCLLICGILQGLRIPYEQKSSTTY